MGSYTEQSRDEKKSRKTVKDLMSSKLEHIKKNLNPEFSYLVFEIFPNALGESPDHQSIINELKHLKAEYIEWDLHVDDATNEQLLVIKLDPTSYDDCVQKIFKVNFPETVRFYIYGNRNRS